VWLLAVLVVVQAGVCISIHRLQFADSSGIGGTVKDQGKSPARCLPVRTTATPEGAASFLKAWSLVPTVPFLSSDAKGNPMSSPSGKAAATPWCRSLLEDVVEATSGEADVVVGGWAM
jgi:hypothetical protein